MLKESSLTLWHGTHVTHADKRVGHPEGLHQLLTSLPWATHIRIFLTPTKKVHKLNIRSWIATEVLTRHTCTPLRLLSHRTHRTLRKGPQTNSHIQHPSGMFGCDPP